MAKAQIGNIVKVHYTVKDSDNQIFETSRGSSPLKFEIGSGSVMPRLDEELQGMQVGDKKTFTVPPEEGYGERQNDLIGTVKKSSFPDHITPTLGQEVQIQLAHGGAVGVTIIGIEGEQVTLDGNHPLAGHSLEFEIEMLDIN
jgi:FKBP-type peptidyl-prolyl cis-trans isomerase 2